VVEGHACHDEHLYTSVLRATPDKSSATSCVTASAMSCAASFTGPSLTCSSFTCHLSASAAWVPALADDNPPSAAPSTPSATSCAASFMCSSFTCSSFTCSSFTCHLRAGVAWAPPLADGDGQYNYKHLRDLAGDDGKGKNLHDEHLHVPVLRGAQHVPHHVLRQVLHVSPKGKRCGTRVYPGLSLRCSKSSTRPPPHSPRRLGSEAPG